MMNELERYYKESLMADLCDEYKGYWRNAMNDKEKLIKLSLCQQSIPHFATFCHQKKGLSRNYLKKEFGKYINGYTIHDADNVSGYTYGLYADWDYDTDLYIDKDVTHVMWTVGATLVVPVNKCPTIYASNNSNVHLVCDGYNSVRLYLFDKSKVAIEDADNNCQITVFKYDEHAKVEKGKYCLCDKIHEHQKELRL